MNGTKRDPIRRAYWTADDPEAESDPSPDTMGSLTTISLYDVILKKRMSWREANDLITALKMTRLPEGS